MAVRSVEELTDVLGQFHLYYGADLPKIQDLVRTFSFEHNLLGENVASPDVIGIEMPAGTLGDKANIKLRFDPTYMQMAADGKL